ncbi:MAG TPA: POTRA domain-containing protein, partial [Blastocatellia bacterium]|nr:POTRA domain-containing protein [Blastocatellia bacterium]
MLLIAAGAERALCSDVGDYLGRRVTSVEIVIEGVTGGNTSEMRALLEVAPGQDYSPVRIHDSLVRLYRSGLISGARVEGVAVGADGVTLRFIVKPQARIDNVVFQGSTVFEASALRARLNELDPGERLSAGAVERGLGELLAFYTSRGYFQAKITSEIELGPTGTLATVVYRITPGEPATVSAYTLDIRGARVDLSKLEHAIREGERFTQTAVAEEMERIRRAYIAQNYLAVRVSDKTSADVINNTVAVTISVESGPLVIIEVEGLELSDEQKREILPVYQLGGLDDFTLEEGRRSLQDYAQRQGYFFAEVTRPPAPTSPGETVRLNYVVETGNRYRLTDIDIEGVSAIPSQELQDQMKSREATIIPFFGLNRGLTSNEILRQDANLIQKRLREVGYRRSVVDVRRGVSVEGDRLLITFAVEQGPRTHVESIDIRGNTVLTADLLRERLTIEPGDPFLTTAVTQSADQLNAAYHVRGYANAEVFSELVELGMVEGEERVRLIYNISEGNRVRIRNVNTRGVAQTNIGRLERDFYMFKVGDWLREDQLLETERVLYDTNAFNTVTITSEPIGQFA